MDNEAEEEFQDAQEEAEEHQELATKPRELPLDLPRNLDDRRPVRDYSQQEFYDDWSGKAELLTAPMSAKSLSFNLSLHEPDQEDAFGRDFGGYDAAMLAAQARKGNEIDAGEMEEDTVLANKDLSLEQRTQKLQEFLFLAASNGDAKRVQRLVRGQPSDFLRLNAVDAEGTPPLVYASCFGHKDVVLALLDAGATVDTQDRNQWTALMWAITNRHKDIAKILLDHGASTDIKSSSGRTALDFVPPNSDMSEFLQHSGNSIGSVGVSEDFYNSGFSQDRFEEELAESEMRRRMMMESAINLEVDLGNLGLDEQPESPEELDEGQEFIWDRCLNDQMFVFMESDIERILDVVVTNMTPQRSPSQKPVPANIVFLGARYAHYHANKELLADWLESAQEKIYAVVDRYQWDMTILAFWISNATLLLYYLKKDPGLTEATVQFQAQMAELIHEIYILIIRDAERRMDKVLDTAMLDHETIPGFEDVAFQNEWKFLRTKSKVKPEPMEKRYRPPSPKRKAQVSPRNITSLLSSTLFVLDLYDVHSVIMAQILSQLYYWVGAELFNRIMSNKRYLARTKAMQIRMNVSTLEDWARTNNRQPDHYENGSMTATGETTVDSARRHLAPVVQLLQWLQCFSSLGEDKDALATTLQQLPNVSARQLLHAVKHYRAEVGERTLGKVALKYIQEVKSRPKVPVQPEPHSATGSGATQSPAVPADAALPNGKALHPPIIPQPDEDEAPETNLLNPALLLPFHLPTSTDMLISYGAGFGGMNKERERRYIPSVPPEFLAKLEPDGNIQPIVQEAATPVKSGDIDSTFNGSIDLVNKALGSRILAFSDEWFAAADNLTTPTPPIRKPGVFTYAGAWYDGWETRRHNPEAFDWVVIRLGVASGRVNGVEIDTAYFNGNQAPEIAVQGCFALDDQESEVKSKDFVGWETILAKQECGPSQRHGWLLSKMTDKAYTHVRLQMFPDGGIARFRLYGEVVPVLPQDVGEIFDLAATVNGGVAVACSDQHFGKKDNLLLPGRGVDMGDGWETKRSRGEHVDWVIVRLGLPGIIDRLVIDTAHFRGNYPQKVQVFAALQSDTPPSHDSHSWIEILPPQQSGPDKEHEYARTALQHVESAYAYVKLVIIPDGGVKRIRVYGRRA
ncbi:hypothetical protein BAUCODRAFT_123141 [Baudoinia panamericana UAMH 10762]|uniref:allantoicase n=1 Tax=Baudoinia panamericana (strain UAMH 10762) TaxID=717646 RepID=M2N9P4_BAUPA|nr:uncharacterized protein BAUCODRAFT_123141 [Baudoinia panamericana UAMH 10762]EMC95849.1 hypothetical protein BAUCODRAFT_123141 [Baudoinia panamericana UAMH 10762]